MDELIAAFIFFFAVIGPIGTVPVFIAVTGNYEEQVKKHAAIRTTLVSAQSCCFS
jgi:multiple antibiotic resistance protein